MTSGPREPGFRSQSYETVLMGSSLAANYRPFWFDVFYETSTVKVTFQTAASGNLGRRWTTPMTARM